MASGMDMMMDALKRFIPAQVWDVVQTNVTKMAEKVNSIEARQARIEEKVNSIEARQARIEEKTDKIFELCLLLQKTPEKLLEYTTSLKEHRNGTDG